MIWLILFLGLLLRLVSLNQSLWLDEAINVVAAQKFSLWGMIAQYAHADFHPPGWFIVLWSWGKLFGYSEVALRLPSVIFGVLTVYITYLIGKKLVSKNLGLLAALLLSINPLHIYYSQEARMYSLATLAVAVNVLLLIRLIKGAKINLAFLVLSNIFILMSDYVAYLIYPAEIVIFFLIRKIATSPAKGGVLAMTWFGALFIAAILSIWWLPVFLNQLDTGLTISSRLPTWKFIVGAFDSKTIPLTFVKFIIGRIGLTDKMIYAAILLPVVCLFTYLLWRGAKFLSNLPRNLNLTWVIVPPLLATTASIFIPVYSYFRVLFIIPGFVILIANGILSFKNKLRYVFLTLVVLIQLFCALVYLLNPNYQREDWRGLVSFFKGIQPPMILFESSGILPPFDYYAKDTLNAKGALRDFPAKDKNSVADLESLLKNKRGVYLVDYLVQITDPQRLVAEELVDLGYKEKDIKNFNGVGFVYYYEKNE